MRINPCCRILVQDFSCSTQKYFDNFAKWHFLFHRIDSTDTYLSEPIGTNLYQTSANNSTRLDIQKIEIS